MKIDEKWITIDELNKITNNKEDSSIIEEVFNTKAIYETPIQINKFKNELWEKQANKNEKEKQIDWQNKNVMRRIPETEVIDAIISRWNYLNSEEYDEEKAKEKNKQTEMNNKINTEFNNIEEKIKIYTEKFINDIKLESPKDNKYTILFQPSISYSEKAKELFYKKTTIDIKKWNKIREEIRKEMEKNSDKDSKNIIKIILKEYTDKKYNLEKIKKDKNIKKNIENAANVVIPIGRSGDMKIKDVNKMDIIDEKDAKERENIENFLEKKLGYKSNKLKDTTIIDIFEDTYNKEKKKYFKFDDDFLHIETVRYKILELVFNYIKKRYDKIKYDKEITGSDDVSRENFYNWLVKKQLAMGENKTLTYNNNISIQLGKIALKNLT